MRRIIAIIIALSVLGIAVLGFASMAHENSHNPGSCIGFATGANCPAKIASFSDVAGHIAAVQGFSLGIITSSLFMGVLLVVTFWFFRQKIFNIQDPPGLAYQRERTIQYDVPLTHRFLKWLARHEARDPHAFFRVHEHV